MTDIKDLSKRLREARSKNPFVPTEEWQFSDQSNDLDCPNCGEEVECSGFVVKSSDQYQAVDLHLYGMEKICKPQAEFIILVANHITEILDELDRLIEVEKVLRDGMQNIDNTSDCKFALEIVDEALKRADEIGKKDSV